MGKIIGIDLGTTNSCVYVMSEITRLSLTAVRDKLAAKEIKAEEAVAACLDRIAATEPKIKAILHLDAGKALAQAKALDTAGPDPAKRLWGVPVLIKDAICVKDAPTTCASKILENFVPFYDATSVEKLEAAGAIILGKTNMDVSDGLARDLPRMLAPGTGAALTIAPEACHPELCAWAAANSSDPILDLVLGGEDYALLGAVAPDDWPRVAKAVPGAWQLGCVRDKPGITVNGQSLTSRGFDHFG